MKTLLINTVMQRLLLIWILSIISFGIHADTRTPQVVIVPYLEVQSDKISMEDEAQCDDEAWYAASMLHDTRDDIPLSEQLDIWSLPAEFWEDGAPDSTRMAALVNLTWVIAHTYPDLAPTEYDDLVYSTCIANKPLITDKVQF